MLAAGRRWLKKHQTPIAVGFGVVGAGYLAVQYVGSKLTEAKDRLIGDRAARENLRRRFEQNQLDCSFTVFALLPTATESIFETLPVEQLTAELQQRKKSKRRSGGGANDAGGADNAGETRADGSRNDSPSLLGESYLHASQIISDASSSTVTPTSTTTTSASVATEKRRSRSELWHELKITTLTRTVTLAYTLSLLVLLVRIQLNLLGKQTYLTSVVALASPTPKSPHGITLKDLDETPEQVVDQDYGDSPQYLAFSWWLLHTGCKQLMEKVKTAVMEVFGPLSPREGISQQQLRQLTEEVRRRVEGDKERDGRSMNWLPYLLPPSGREEYVLRVSGVLDTEKELDTFKINGNLRQLLDETSDLIESPHFSRILALLVGEAFSLLIDQKCAAEAFPAFPASQDQKQDRWPARPKTKLASVLAVMSQQSYVIGNGTEMPNEYINAMEQGVPDLDSFAAVIYSSNLDVGIDKESHGPTCGTTVQDRDEPLSRGVIVSDQNDRNTSQQSVLTIDDAFEKAWGQASHA